MVPGLEALGSAEFAGCVDLGLVEVALGDMHDPCTLTASTEVASGG